MIQRKQTLWLILAAAASFLSLKFPFYTGTILENGMSHYETLYGASNLFILALTAISILVSVITIFLYKDRKTQLWMAILGILVSAGLLALYITQIKKFDSGNIALTAIFVVAIVVFFFLAARGIQKDQKLVKSLDKLR